MTRKGEERGSPELQMVQRTRAAANAAWIERVFGRAREEHAPAVVLNLRLTIDPKAKGPFSWVRVPLN